MSLFRYRIVAVECWPSRPARRAQDIKLRYSIADNVSNIVLVHAHAKGYHNFYLS